MIKRYNGSFFMLISILVPMLCGDVASAAQTAKATLPIVMTVTNPQCSINEGKGLPDTIQLPVVTTAGLFADGNSVEVPIVIRCAGIVSKLEIMLTGGSSSKISTSNNMVDISLAWKKGGAVQFGTPVALNKAPYLLSDKEFDATLLATVTPHTGAIPAGIYTANLPITLVYY
ncbi:TPA: fimbrial protein [Escherichia coli]|nr:fimbrial protein [Escherichia coli]HBA7664126.1 fimbrial protein [Escherichia coli]HBA9701316.1 fimbrial protein [Escherichia coli]